MNERIEKSVEEFRRFWGEAADTVAGCGVQDFLRSALLQEHQETVEEAIQKAENLKRPEADINNGYNLALEKVIAKLKSLHEQNNSIEK